MKFTAILIVSVGPAWPPPKLLHVRNLAGTTPGVPIRVAVVEDDLSLRTTLIRGLREEGFVVVLNVGNGADLLRAVDRGLQADVLILDVGLPDCDGRDLCLALRAAEMDAPVLFLTARDGIGDRLSGFHAGADDYLPKPFSFAELVVRLAALGRRQQRPAVPRPRVELDPGQHGARLGERRVPLTPTEFRVLSILLAHRGEVVRRHRVIAAAWPDGAIVHDNTLDAYVARVRRKLRDLDQDRQIEVVTVRGVGYRVG